MASPNDGTSEKKVIQPKPLEIWDGFRGKSVFVTGGTGFVGQAFLFKMLKEFPDLQNVFCLVREKKSKDPQHRFDELLHLPSFEALKKSIPDDQWQTLLKKVVPVSGNLLEDRLGMTEANYKELCNKVNYVVHIAATINFQEKIKRAVQLNVRGTLQMHELATRCQNLDAMVHTSTCYVNYGRRNDSRIFERLYPLSFDPEEMVKYITEMPEKSQQKETDEILAKYGFPNTYCFTKNIAEQLLSKRRASNFPLAIVRPAIIGGALTEPFPGWVAMPTGLANSFLLSAGIGLMHEVWAKEGLIVDVIPVDTVANTIIKAGYKTAVFYRTVKENPHIASVFANAHPLIYAAASSTSRNPMVNTIYRDVATEFFRANTSPNMMISKPSMLLTESKFLYTMAFYTKRIIPLYALKSFLTVFGSPEKKAQIDKLYKKVSALGKEVSVAHWFTLNEFRYDNRNAEHYLNQGLSEESQKRFPSAVPSDMEWADYMRKWSSGLNWFLKQHEKKSAKAKTSGKPGATSAPTQSPPPPPSG